MKKKSTIVQSQKAKKPKLSKHFVDDEAIEDSNSEATSDEEGDNQRIKTVKAKRPKKTGARKGEYSEVNEINNFKETENLYHSNLFRLQIDELLQEIKLTPKRHSSLVEWVEQVKNALYELEESQQLLVCDKSWQEKLKVKIPLAKITLDAKTTLKIMKPAGVETIGSFAHSLTVSNKFDVDLMVQMPKAMLKNSDYLNQRYMEKRAIYLAFIANHVSSCSFVGAMSYTSLHGATSCLPILTIAPKGTLSKYHKIRIMISPEEGSFKANRFIPERNNIRSSYGDPSAKTATDPATPHANSYMLYDMFIGQLNKYIGDELHELPQIKRGILLLKIWLRQRSLDHGIGAFGGFLITMFVLYLLKKKRLNSLMSCYQVARTTWLALAGDEWPDSGISLAPPDVGLQPTQMMDYFGVVFVDPTGYLNLCHNVSAQTLLHVKHEAKLAIEYINKQQMNSFQMLFMTAVLFNRKFDSLLRISDLSQLQTVVEKLDLSSHVMDYCGNRIMATRHQIIDVIKRAAGSRIALVDFCPISNKEWGVNAAPPSDQSNEHLTIGFMLNVDTYCDVLIKGPNGDDPKAQEFRDFWGDKSSLRRFQDGSICEAVVWNGPSMSAKRNVMQHIVVYVLSRHVGLDASKMKYICNQLDFAVGLDKAVLPAHIGRCYGTGEEANMAVLHSLHKLSTGLRKLTDMPLTVCSVQGVSAEFRLTEIFPSLPHKCTNEDSYEAIGSHLQFANNYHRIPDYVKPLEVVLELEGSGKWPDDLQALTRIKAALYIQMAKLIGEQMLLKTVPFPTHLHLYQDGYVFRLIVACHKEIVLLKTVNEQGHMTVLRDNNKSVELHMKTVTVPKLTSYIHGIEKQHAGFSIAARLAKRWLSCQMLASHVSHLSIELLVAHVFCDPAPYSVPSTPIAAFHRFLALLSTHDWASTPLICNFNNLLSADEVAEIQADFGKNRLTLAHMFISCPFDKRSDISKHEPTVALLHRLIVVAQESLQVLNSAIGSPQISCFKSLFRPSLKCYDVVINLKKHMVPKNYQRLDVANSTTLNVSHKLNVDDKMPIVDFDPVHMYLAELQNCFADIALFFYDHCGGNVIGVLFKPAAKSDLQFKMASVEYKLVDQAERNMKVNMAAILDDFLHLGKGLVDNIQNFISPS